MGSNSPVSRMRLVENRVHVAAQHGSTLGARGHVREQRSPPRAPTHRRPRSDGRCLSRARRGTTAGPPAARACARRRSTRPASSVLDEEVDNVGIAIEDLGPGDLIDVGQGQLAVQSMIRRGTRSRSSTSRRATGSSSSATGSARRRPRSRPASTCIATTSACDATARRRRRPPAPTTPAPGVRRSCPAHDQFLGYRRSDRTGRDAQLHRDPPERQLRRDVARLRRRRGRRADRGPAGVRRGDRPHA